MSLELNEVDQAIEVAFKEASAVETFARRIENLNQDIERQSGSLLDQRDAAVAEREWLMHELAQLSVSEVELN